MNGAEIPLKIRFNVFDVKSPLLSRRTLRKHGYSVLLEQQQTIQKEGTTIVLPSNSSCTCPGDRPTQSDVQILVRMLRQRKRKRKSSPQPWGAEQQSSRAKGLGVPALHWRQGCEGHVPRDGRQQLRVNGCAVEKKRRDKFVEPFLLNCLESFGVTGEMVLQADKETGPTDVAKRVAAERKATTIIRQTPKKIGPSKRVRGASTPKCRSHGQNHERGDRRQSKNHIERDPKHHGSDDSTRSFLANTFH